MSEIKTVFDFQAQVGLTKHMGSLPATRELVKLCQILPGYRVLDVGCGAGRTPVFLAKEYELRMIGVDLHPGMVAASRELARREKVEGRVSFRQADAQDLPFEDNSFDAVIVESVTAFPPDQQQAVREYARVLKPGGYVGMNESTYLQPNPPVDIQDWVSQESAMNAQIHTSQGWQTLLENAGLEVMAVRLFPLDVKKEAAETMKRYGMRGLVRTWSRALGMFVTRPEVRDIMKQGTVEAPSGLMDYFGYGLFVGRKPDR
jgi:ubiquinone/menaquinone biosynthesis C-methylase UbiE